MAGEDCYLIKVRTKDPTSLGKVIREKIGSIETVISTRTTIVLESYKETVSLPIKNGNGHKKA